MRFRPVSIGVSIGFPQIKGNGMEHLNLWDIKKKLKPSVDRDRGQLEELEAEIQCLRENIAALLLVLKERRVLNDEEIEQVIRGF